jgi:REP element-mobilizing transposase RayT
MSRPLRIEFPGAIYHVTSRGDRREPIFDDDQDRAAFLDVVGTALDRFDACALAYCLMGNHYHLILHTRSANLSRLMRQINGVYTQAYNRRHRKVGHLFQGRFKAILVDRDAYLLEVCRYVDLNPVRAHMVPHPADWPWSSYQAHVGSQLPQAWLDTPSVHGYLLGRDVATSRDAKRAALRYERLVEQGKDVNLWDDALKQQIYLGDETFVVRMQALLEPERVRSAEVPRTQRRSKPGSIQAYLKAYERNEAMMRACREGGHTLSAIAREVGLSVSRISRIIAAGEGMGAKGKT